MPASHQEIKKRLDDIERAHKELRAKVNGLSRPGVVKRIEALGVHLNRVERESRARLAHFFAVYVVCTQVGVHARRLPADAALEIITACLWAMDFFDAEWWHDALKKHEEASIEEWAKILLCAHRAFVASPNDGERAHKPWQRLSERVLGGAIRAAMSAPRGPSDRIEINEALDFLFADDGGAQGFCDAAGVDSGQLRARLGTEKQVAANLKRWTGAAR